MSYHYIYEPQALTEYKEAISWYLDRSETAANNFVKEIKEKIVTICTDPLRYRSKHKKMRETSLKKYPYSIVYFVNEQKQLIISPLYIITKEIPAENIKDRART
jgi:plasmid stabilization system protein ParE